METEMGEVMVMYALRVTWLFSESIAVIVTLPRVGGAVYVVLAPLAVPTGVKVPHVFKGAQLQVTPRCRGSFKTVTAICVVPFTGSVAGGLTVRNSVIGLGVPPPLVPPPQEDIAAANRANPHVHAARECGLLNHAVP